MDYYPGACLNMDFVNVKRRKVDLRGEITDEFFFRDLVLKCPYTVNKKERSILDFRFSQRSLYSLTVQKRSLFVTDLHIMPIYFVFISCGS